MTWAAVVSAIVAFLAPYIKRWLENLLNQAAQEMAGRPESVSAVAGCEALFNAAEAQLWWFQFGKRGALSIARKIAMARAPEVWAAVRLGTEPPRLAKSEREELKAAFGE